MAVEFFEDANFRGATEQMILDANDIIEEYKTDGFILTLRQLYYQFVARDLLKNSESSYGKLGSAITKGRIAGRIDWDAIEDRGRSAVRVQGEETAQEVLSGIEYGLILDPWKEQESYIEVWIEKEALHNTIERVCDRYRVTHMACKGYLSASEAWRAGHRFRWAARRGKRCTIIHLGDHDPSGIDMTRDNQARVSMFARSHVEINRIALNMDQIDAYNPPPNPAKLSDTRAQDYISEYGTSSWELDALRPHVLEELVKEAIIEQVTDLTTFDAVQEEEDRRRELLVMLREQWDEVEEFLTDQLPE